MSSGCGSKPSSSICTAPLSAYLHRAVRLVELSNACSWTPETLTHDTDHVALWGASLRIRLVALTYSLNMTGRIFSPVGHCLTSLYSRFVNGVVLKIHSRSS